MEQDLTQLQVSILMRLWSESGRVTLLPHDSITLKGASVRESPPCTVASLPHSALLHHSHTVLHHTDSLLHHNLLPHCYITPYCLTITSHHTHTDKWQAQHVKDPARGGSGKLRHTTQQLTTRVGELCNAVCTHPYMRGNAV